MRFHGSVDEYGGERIHFLKWMESSIIRALVGRNCVPVNIIQCTKRNCQLKAIYSNAITNLSHYSRRSDLVCFAVTWRSDISLAVTRNPSSGELNIWYSVAKDLQRQQRIKRRYWPVCLRINSTPARHSAHWTFGFETSFVVLVFIFCRLVNGFRFKKSVSLLQFCIFKL